MNFTANTPEQKEMSRYIEIKIYDQFEKYHAGWQETVNKIKTIVSNHFKNSKIIEHGPGTGNSTEIFAQIPNSKIDAIELDYECYEKLLSNMKKFKNINPINISSLDYNATEKYDAVLAMFSLTHLDENKMKIFLANCREIYLKKDGLLVIGDEFLPAHNINNPQSRLKALASHHNNIIAKAILDDKPELARIELEAMISGYNKEGDFKVTCKEFEKRLKNAGFTFKKFKIYPLRGDFALSRKLNTGVYVYEAKLI